MSVNKKIVVFILLCFCLQGAYAQVNPSQKDAKTKKDSSEVYQKIRNYSKKINLLKPCTNYSSGETIHKKKKF